jgi:uncharacterized membrane protein
VIFFAGNEPVGIARIVLPVQWNLCILRRRNRLSHAREKHQEVDMRTIVIAAAFSLVAAGTLISAGYAQDTCAAQASAKKLAGAAKNSFMKKCETEAGAACEADSKAKKLAGAAKTSHMKKCVTDRVGS